MAHALEVFTKYLNSKNLYEPFRGCHYITIKDGRTGTKRHKTVKLTSQQRYLIDKLNLKLKLLKI